jgi:hypothetical protein
VIRAVLSNSLPVRVMRVVPPFSIDQTLLVIVVIAVDVGITPQVSGHSPICRMVVLTVLAIDII